LCFSVIVIYGLSKSSYLTALKLPDIQPAGKKLLFYELFSPLPLKKLDTTRIYKV